MPRKYLDGTAQAVKKLADASMRPGRMPRKYLRRTKRTASETPGFNEAGADAPEIPFTTRD